MTFNDDIYTLSGGREFYANNGIIGLAPDGTTYEGYDGDIDTEDWSVADCLELADTMIDRWTQWRTRHQQQKPESQS